MMQHLWVLLTILLTTFWHAEPYPSVPGTCQLDRMATIGHGPSKSTCEGCYQINVKPNANNVTTMTITITGPATKPYQGILLFVKNDNNTTVGEFVAYDESQLAPVACDDDDNEVIRDDIAVVLGQIDPNLKHWPLEVGWTVADPASKSSSLKVYGMVVLDYENFHILPDTSFRLPTKSELVPSSFTSSTVSTQTPLPQPDTNLPLPSPYTSTAALPPLSNLLPTVPDLAFHEDFEEPGQPKQLFLNVLFTILTLYFIMSFAHWLYMHTQRRAQHVDIIQ